MRIDISIAQQRLTLSDDDGKVLRAYAVSTAAKGAGTDLNDLIISFAENPEQ